MVNHSHSCGPLGAPLEPIMPFSSRLSPLMSPSSPVSNSPLSAGLSAASYERDRRYEREADHFNMGQPSLAPEHSYRMGKQTGYMSRDPGPF